MIDRESETDGDLQALADRHGVGLDAVRHLLWALEAGNGTMAQFNHPELGGFGQWSSGGMIMIGQMFDSDLKARVASLCADLTRMLPRAGGSHGPSSAGWWPPELGRPSAAGAQNGRRYAYFPESRRLAIEVDGALALYDTGDHDIAGVSQSQGDGNSLRFSGRGGSVALDQLRRLDGPEPPTGEVPARPFEPQPFHPEPIAARPPSVQPPVATGGDALAILERLAELHGRGILTDAEFSAKKADLLARL